LSGAIRLSVIDWGFLSSGLTLSSSSDSLCTLSSGIADKNKH